MNENNEKKLNARRRHTHTRTLLIKCGGGKKRKDEYKAHTKNIQ